MPIIDVSTSFCVGERAQAGERLGLVDRCGRASGVRSRIASGTARSTSSATDSTSRVASMVSISVGDGRQVTVGEAPGSRRRPSVVRYSPGFPARSRSRRPRRSFGRRRDTRLARAHDVTSVGSAERRRDTRLARRLTTSPIESFGSVAGDTRGLADTARRRRRLPAHERELRRPRRTSRPRTSTVDRVALDGVGRQERERDRRARASARSCRS